MKVASFWRMILFALVRHRRQQASDQGQTLLQLDSNQQPFD
jgi:hypothetical protein